MTKPICQEPYGDVFGFKGIEEPHACFNYLNAAHSIISADHGGIESRVTSKKERYESTCRVFSMRLQTSSLIDTRQFVRSLDRSVPLFIMINSTFHRRNNTVKMGKRSFEPSLGVPLSFLRVFGSCYFIGGLSSLTITLFEQQPFCIFR